MRDTDFHPDGYVVGPSDISDDELSDLALAADPTAPIDPDCVPWTFAGGVGANLLPDWYMPRPIASGRGRGTRIVVVSVVAGMMVVCAFGLCVTSGFLQWA